MKIAILILWMLLLACPSVQASEQKDLGALSQQQASQYINKHPDVGIINVISSDHYARKHFSGVVDIPIENISRKENNTPERIRRSGRKILCGILEPICTSVWPYRLQIGIVYYFASQHLP